GDAVMGTIMTAIREHADLTNPNVVKVVADRRGYALYFSRSEIPFRRHLDTSFPTYKHIGLYAYRREFLLRFPQLEPTPLECAESLEQLRAIEHGYRIRIREVQATSIEVDT